MKKIATLAAVCLAQAAFSKGGPVNFTVQHGSTWSFPLYNETVEVVMNEGDSCHLAASSPSPDYMQWLTVSRDGNPVLNSTGGGPYDIWLKAEGLYTATGHNTSTWSDKTVYVHIVFATATGTNEHTAEPTAILAYPNPATSNFTLQVPYECESIVVNIYNAAGKIVYTNPFVKKGNLAIQCGSWVQGVYLVQVQAGDIRKTIKLVVTE